MEINSLKPESPKWLLDKYKKLREEDEKRDKDFSPIHDAIMNAISSNLKEYCDEEVFSKAWTSSMFPERLTKEILRLIEELSNKSV